MIYTFMYMFFAAFSSILRAIVGSKAPIMLSLFLSVLLATLFFHLVNSKNLKSVYRNTFNLKKQYAFAAFSILVVWIGSFFIPVYYTATIQIFSFMLITSWCGSLRLFYKSVDFLSFLQFLLISIVLLVFYILYFSSHPFFYSLGMLGMTLSTGIFGYLYFFYSSRLNQGGLSASEILTVRFLPLLLLSLFFVLKERLYFDINPGVIAGAVLVGATSLIIPVYCAQKSIEKIGPEFHSVLIGLSPFATFLLEWVILKTVNYLMGFLSIALFLAVSSRYVLSALKKGLARD